MMILFIEEKFVEEEDTKKIRINKVAKILFRLNWSQGAAAALSSEYLET